MLSASFDDFMKLVDGIEGDIARAATEAMFVTALSTRDELRDQTRSVGLGDRMPDTWTARAYPDGEKNSINPAGLVWSRAPDIMDAFTRGATIRPIGGAQFLWIPTANVPRARTRSGRIRGNGQRPQRLASGAITPEECESRFNTDFVMRRGRAGRLLAFMDLVAGRARRGGSNVRAATRRRVAAGREPKLTLMFVLTRSVTMPKLFDLDASAGRWVARFEQALDARLPQA
ncbi:DUF6441 family protein [Sphingomonas sp. BK235]|uniref:DUF6441 family protein n=1 Tax=Sphingomonas sp. BK235 TaxID=2512131 RepID=UPI001046C846|nr:DUF6441 family protein [Sphingomonas sp. BK235]TCP30696.1 hypothetical protein EV292_11253 [Sphingomonas sp. BK235]